MRNQKGFVPFIIILLSLIGFIGVYYLGTLKPKPVSEQPAETKDTWRVYKNIKLGFSVEIPAV